MKARVLKRAIGYIPACSSCTTGCPRAGQTGVYYSEGDALSCSVKIEIPAGDKPQWMCMSEPVAFLDTLEYYSVVGIPQEGDYLEVTWTGDTDLPSPIDARVRVSAPPRSFYGWSASSDNIPIGVFPA